jgi:hypothetical protein
VHSMKCTVGPPTRHCEYTTASDTEAGGSIACRVGNRRAIPNSCCRQRTSRFRAAGGTSFRAIRPQDAASLPLAPWGPRRHRDYDVVDFSQGIIHDLFRQGRLRHFTLRTTPERTPKDSAAIQQQIRLCSGAVRVQFVTRNRVFC